LGQDEHYSFFETRLESVLGNTRFWQCDNGFDLVVREKNFVEKELNFQRKSSDTLIKGLP